jgi:hypothetical protein
VRLADLDPSDILVASEIGTVKRRMARARPAAV